VSGLDEIYAYGFRNPYRIGFDSVTGNLYVGDVGQNHIEEINRVTRGNNYGWRYREGGFYFDPNGENDGRVVTQPVEPKPSKTPVDPLAQYDHGDGLAVVGGYVYRAGAIAGWKSAMFGRFFPWVWNSLRTIFYLDSPGNQIREFRIGQSDRALVSLSRVWSGSSRQCFSVRQHGFGTLRAQGKVLKIVPVKKSPLWRIF
jgi:hypothetical protein